MIGREWDAATAGDGIEIAEQYIAEANAATEPIKAIDRYLLAIDVMQIHIGRMDTASEMAQLSVLQPGQAADGSVGKTAPAGTAKR